MSYQLAMMLLFLGNAALFLVWCGAIYRRFAKQECPLCGRGSED